MKRNSIKSSVDFYKLIVFVLFSVPLICEAQYIEEYPLNKGNADKMMEIKNYPEAVRQFEALYKEEPNEIDYKFKLGISYTNSNINQAKGLELLTEVYQSANKPDGTDKEYALALLKNYKYQEAIDIYKQLLNESSGEEKVFFTEKIKQCEEGVKLLQKPIQVIFENLGDRVNSKAPDYLPMIVPDESVLIFATRRDGVVGNLYDYGGYRTADIVISKHKRNKYSRARSIGSPNTYGNEETAGISENGEYVIYHVDSDDSYSDIFVSQKGRRSFMPAKELASEKVNQKSAEPGACLTNDGQTLFFCSDREGGFGGYDIYSIKRLPTGEWSEPRNLGASINTSKDDMYPSIRGNGNVLYFASDGYPGLGGLDLFKSVYTNGKWTSPKNLGYPINTSSDDYNIAFTENPRYAYVAANREDSFGDLDIYRVVFMDEREELTLVQGQLTTEDSTLIKEEIIIEIFNRDSGELYGSYLSDAKSAKYNAILPPGRYRIEIIDAENYQDFEKDFNLQDKNDFIPLKQLSIVLKPR